MGGHLRYNRKRIALIILLVALVWYYYILPDPLFFKPVSLVLLDKKGQLLGARIADDGQWRFPHDNQVPEKFEKCLIAFEDKRFYDHVGVDLLAAGRAVVQNVSSMRTVSGASTITMQVIRMSRNRDRNIFEKIIEAAMATRLEIKCSKKEILGLYTSNAPFGGNVVGLQAASWRYYGKSPQDLSWAEAASLAVLPNSPSSIHPGKNRDRMKKKRDRLLNLLLEQNQIDSLTCALAILEPLPGIPRQLPDMAPHLISRIYLERKKERKEMKVIASTLDITLQKQVNKVVASLGKQLEAEGVYNTAVLVADVSTGNVLAYVGNREGAGQHMYVDNVTAPRSTGSILKPLLYACMLEEGKLLPGMLVPDIPTHINGYTPKNFNYTYDGAVPAANALSRSLNIPAIHMLKSYTPERFIFKLKKFGLSTLHRPAKNYGLSLILGGAEANLWDVAGAYTGMAGTLEYYNRTGKYRNGEFGRLNYILEKENGGTTTLHPEVISAGAVYTTFEALLEVARPEEDQCWRLYASGKKIAWKTGTSFGNRDAWAIGCTRDFVVAVWVGNSSGEGRPGMTGVHSAAPLLFEIFNLLPASGDWFEQPVATMEKISVCSVSGFVASEMCPETREIFIPVTKGRRYICPYHHIVFLDSAEEYRVNAGCAKVADMVRRVWFVLPPSMEKYYKLSHSSYRELPPFRSDCSGNGPLAGAAPLEIVYPAQFARIRIPKRNSNERSKMVFEAAHTNLSATLFWHLDSNYLGSTAHGLHEIGLDARPGLHRLTVVDDAGNRLEREFEVVE